MSDHPHAPQHGLPGEPRDKAVWITWYDLPEHGQDAHLSWLLLSFLGWAKHAILYEYASLEARNKNYLTLEDGHPEIKAWSDRIVSKTRHAPGSASLATRIWPPIST